MGLFTAVTRVHVAVSLDRSPEHTKAGSVEKKLAAGTWVMGPRAAHLGVLLGRRWVRVSLEMGRMVMTARVIMDLALLLEATLAVAPGAEPGEIVAAILEAPPEAVWERLAEASLENT